MSLIDAKKDYSKCINVLIKRIFNLKLRLFTLGYGKRYYPQGKGDYYLSKEGYEYLQKHFTIKRAIAVKAVAATVLTDTCKNK